MRTLLTIGLCYNYSILRFSSALLAATSSLVSEIISAAVTEVFVVKGF